MEYRRIDENTIRCIISQEDMENFGLDLDEFLTHSQKSDEFLRHIVEEARDELGYQTGHGMVSMRLEVLQDGRISLTFVNGSEEKVKEQMIKHLRQIFPDVEPTVLDKILHQLSRMSEKERAQKVAEMLSQSLEQTFSGLQKLIGDKVQQAKQKEKQQNVAEAKPSDVANDSYRMFRFAHMSDAISFTKAIGLSQPVRSHLYKADEGYYLIVERYRIADRKYNMLTLVAFDYGQVIADADATYRHLIEHAQLLIENRAFGVLRKL